MALLACVVYLLLIIILFAWRFQFQSQELFFVFFTAKIHTKITFNAPSIWIIACYIASQDICFATEPVNASQSMTAVYLPSVICGGPLITAHLLSSNRHILHDGRLVVFETTAGRRRVVHHGNHARAP